MGDDGYTYSNETFYMRVDFFTVSPANKNEKKNTRKNEINENDINEN